MAPARHLVMNTQRANSIHQRLSERRLVNGEVDNIRVNIDMTTERIADLERRIMNNTMQLREQSTILDAAIAAEGDNNHGEHLADEFRKLIDHPKLTDARLERDELLLVTTDDLRLHAPDRDDTRHLGTFHIHINLANGMIRLVNQSTKRGGRDHPHVVNGNPCFGSHARAFVQLVTRGDLYALFELLIQYIETLNLEDEYGRFGSYWFDAEDARPVAEAVTA